MLCVWQHHAAKSTPTISSRGHGVNLGAGASGTAAAGRAILPQNYGGTVSRRSSVYGIQERSAL